MPQRHDRPATVLSVSITEAGRRRARTLPYPTSHGGLADTVRANWGRVDGFVLFCATGVAVRVIGPLLNDKASDPVVVVVDEAADNAIALCGGHHGPAISANALAAETAGLLGADPVVTTASDAVGAVALDTLSGFTAGGDIAAVTRRLLDGEPVTLTNPLGWPLPPGLPPVSDLPAASGTVTSGATIAVTDRNFPATTDRPGAGPTSGGTVRAASPRVWLRPPSLVAGVGASTDAGPGDAAALLRTVLATNDLAAESVALAATIDRRASDPVITALDLPVRAFTGDELAPVPVPNPSPVVQREVGTSSVAEAAALLAAGPGATLVVPKVKAGTVTVAIARRTRPVGSLDVVGLGPGHPGGRTLDAVAAVRHAEVVIGYSVYVDQCADLVSAGQQVIRSPIGHELERCRQAADLAAAGHRVALVCSGDPGVFAMATLVLEVAPGVGSPPVRVVPGVTAGLAAGALLGAPLGHDHALVSLSDLLTPWPLIERRLKALAEADMAVALYNPRSARRVTQLPRAFEIMAEHRPAATPVGIVTAAGRPDQHLTLTTLAEADPATVDMFSVVLIGSSTTTVINGRMVTPRGYDLAIDLTRTVQDPVDPSAADPGAVNPRPVDLRTDP